MNQGGWGNRGCFWLRIIRRSILRRMHEQHCRFPGVAARVQPPCIDASQCLKNFDISVIALWLGHESIETMDVYVDADLLRMPGNCALEP
jgi:hypothetical protein